MFFYINTSNNKTIGFLVSFKGTWYKPHCLIYDCKVYSLELTNWVSQVTRLTSVFFLPFEVSIYFALCYVNYFHFDFDLFRYNLSILHNPLMLNITIVPSPGYGILLVFIGFFKCCLNGFSFLILNMEMKNLL